MKPEPKPVVKGVMAERAVVVAGLYKAAALDNKNKAPGIEGKFKFNPDGTFTYTRKTMTATIVTHGSYTAETNIVELVPAKKGANWPDFWQTPASLMVGAGGELAMDGITFTPSLIGKDFTPGLYKCATVPSIHYYFDPNGGYKYTGMGYVSTGEYWISKETDATTKAYKVYLILNILRVDGKRVNYHQKVEVVDGVFDQEGKYKYRHIVTEVK